MKYFSLIISTLGAPALTGAVIAVAGIAIGVGVTVKRRGEWGMSPVLASAATVCLGTILLPTLLRLREPGGFVPSALADWSTGTWIQFSTSPWQSEQITLNVALFVPAGLTCTWLTRRPWWTLAGLAGMSIAIESIQGVFGIGANDVVDVLTNTLGAAIGTGMATLIRWIIAAWQGNRPTFRHLVISVVPLVVALTAVVVGTSWSAERRQASLARHLEARFAGTTMTDYLAWERDGSVSARVIELSPRADGSEHTVDHVTFRYPASVFGIPRCVLVRWDQAGVAIAPARDSACTRPMLT